MLSSSSYIWFHEGADGRSSWCPEDISDPPSSTAGISYPPSSTAGISDPPSSTAGISDPPDGFSAPTNGAPGAVSVTGSGAGGGGGSMDLCSVWLTLLYIVFVIVH